MTDEEITPELGRTLRVALTAGGQLLERVSRARAEQERARHHTTLEQQREAERAQARAVEAGRIAYGDIRNAAVWDHDSSQQRIGEALVATQALRDLDPVAVPAAAYIHHEAHRRYGYQADAWLAAAVQSHLDAAREYADHDQARADVEDAAERLTRDGEATVPAHHREFAVDHLHTVGAEHDGDLAHHASEEARRAEISEATAEAAVLGEGRIDRNVSAQGFPRPAVEDHAAHLGTSTPRPSSSGSGWRRSRVQERGR